MPRTIKKGNKDMKKVLILTLALLLILSSFAGCGGKKNSGEETTAPPTKQETPISDLIGFEKEDNNDEYFNVLLNNSEGAFNMATDFYADETASNVVAQQVLARNRACEDYLGITLKYHPEPGNWNSGMPQKVYNLVSGNSQEYDMVVMGLNTGIMGGYVNIYKNVLDMSYINTDHNWWVQEMEEMVAINDRLVFLTGDACLSTYAYLGCVFANLSVAQNYEVFNDTEYENFYDIVKDGAWTMEEFFSFFMKVDNKTSVGDKYDPNVDTFGWANLQTSVRVMWSSCEMDLIQRQDDGTFAARASIDERIETFARQIQTACDSELEIHFTKDTHQQALNAFANNRCLFASFYVYLMQDFKANNMESHFAVLPLPKYTLQQEDYVSTNISAYNALFFPASITEERTELASKVAEFMGYYGQSRVVPAYYDEYLKHRNNDEGPANVEMLDLIREKLRVTPNELFGTIEDIIGITPTTEKNMDPSEGFYSNPVSVWGKKYPTFNAGVTEYIFQYFR